MTLKTRRVLFYTLVAFFPLIGIAVVFYSNGWRFDPATFTIAQVGGIFFENLPTGVTIKLEKREFNFVSGLIKSSFLIPDLFPKTYDAKISKPEYQTWIKEITVKPSLVTAMPPTILLPDKLNLAPPIAEKIADFWVGPKYFLTLSRNKTLQFQSKKIIGEKVIAWSNDGETIVTKNSSGYFFINLNHPEGAVNLSLIFPQIKKAEFRPNQNNQLIIQSNKGIHLLELGSLAAETIQKDKVLAFAASDNDLIFSIPNAVVAYNFNSKAKEPIFKNELVEDIEISPSGDHLTFLTDSSELFLVEKKSGRQQLLADNARQSKFSPNSQRIAFTTDKKEVVIYDLKTENQKMAEQTAILNIGAAEDNELAWQKNSAYLFIKYPTGLYLLEANGWPPINLQVIDQDNQKYQYLPEKNFVYLLKENSLYNFELQ